TSRSTSSIFPGIRHNLTPSASIASLQTQTSVRSEDCLRRSNRSSLLCIRAFPTKDAPLPGWQLHLVEDAADSFEPLQEPDRYLYCRTLRRSDKEKSLSWKCIKKVCVLINHVVVHGAKLIS